MNKKTLILGGALIILIAIAYAYQGPLKKWQANLGKPKNFLAKAEVDKVDKMEINANGKATTLEKQDERWKVGATKDFYVNKNLAENLIKKLEEAKKSEMELVSANQDKKKEFRTDESGISIKLYEQGSVMADFVIGKAGSDYMSAYISQPNTNNTYAVMVNLYDTFNQNDWRDKIIFSSEKDKIAKVRFQYPGREFVMEKDGESWTGKTPYKFKVDSKKIDEILDVMSDLSAVKIPEQNFTGTGLEKHLIIAQATGEGVDNTLMIGTENEDGLYYAKKGNSDNIYLISKEQRNELNKQIWQLK
ncbi:DUF4340 domain-containing protein [Candidatus Falkowbacteria bacterium]|nr:DUF4340 domain-containing protein [Candidatus Falkowbacteria bacterium]